MSQSRLIDAVLNRACEGMRTLEDIARFVHDDAETSDSLKTLRHEVRDLAATHWSRDDMIRSRDVGGDVGADLTTSSEGLRSGLANIAAAATSRAAEALRSLEEFAKLESSSVAAKLEASRYQLYEWGAAVERRLSAGAPQWRLCLLLTESACRLPWEDVLRAAIQGGVECVQLREKQMDAAQLLQRAKEVVSLCRPHNIPVIINDRLDIAIASGADGVHLGQDDLPIAEARHQSGHGFFIGQSTHGVAEAIKAVDAGADYVGIGSVFPTMTKPSRIPGGVSLLSETLPLLGEIPHLAIGGIDSNNAAEIAAAGGRGIAVGNAICTSVDPASTVRECIEAFETVQV